MEVKSHEHWCELYRDELLRCGLSPDEAAGAVFLGDIELSKYVGLSWGAYGGWTIDGEDSAPITRVVAAAIVRMVLQQKRGA